MIILVFQLEPGSCPIIDLPGVIVTYSNPKLNMDTVATFKCEKAGTMMIGRSSTSCQWDSTWRQPLPYCESEKIPAAKQADVDRIVALLPNVKLSSKIFISFCLKIYYLFFSFFFFREQKMVRPQFKKFKTPLLFYWRT